MKKTAVLISSLFIAYSLNAEKLDISINLNDHNLTQAVDFSADAQEFSFNDEMIQCRGRIVSQDEAGLTLQANIYTLNEQGEFALVSEPTLVAAWNESAQVTIDNKLSINIVASK